MSPTNKSQALVRLIALAAIGPAMASADAVADLQVGSVDGDVDTPLANAGVTSVIKGTAGPDNLVGTPGDDTINGLGGADTMTGLAGNDTYYVDNYDDAIVEDAGGGKDTVRSRANFILPANVENLRLIGTGDISGIGNWRANRIVGNAAHNAIDGGSGNDVLLGNAGSDVFGFSSPLNASTNVDKLPDFDDVEDSFSLCGYVFPLSMDELYLFPDQFHVGASATDPRQRIVYNSTTGVLKYDPDGSW